MRWKTFGLDSRDLDASHADGDAYSSWTDRRDEEYRDGIHVVVGDVESEPPAFHLEFAVDGHRFTMKFEQFFEGYTKRDRDFPQEWLNEVKCKVNRYQQSGTSAGYSQNSYWTKRQKWD